MSVLTTIKNEHFSLKRRHVLTVLQHKVFNRRLVHNDIVRISVNMYIKLLKSVIINVQLLEYKALANSIFPRPLCKLLSLQIFYRCATFVLRMHDLYLKQKLTLYKRVSNLKCCLLATYTHSSPYLCLLTLYHSALCWR